SGGGARCRHLRALVRRRRAEVTDRSAVRLHCGQSTVDGSVTRWRARRERRRRRSGRGRGRLTAAAGRWGAAAPGRPAQRVAGSEPGTVEPPDQDRDRARMTPVALSGFAMLVLLTAIAVVIGLLGGGGSVPVDAAPSDQPSASDPDSSAPPDPDPAPSPVPPSPWRLVRVGDPVTVSTDFYDPGTNDTHTCDIEW